MSSAVLTLVDAKMVPLGLVRTAVLWLLLLLLTLAAIASVVCHKHPPYLQIWLLQLIARLNGRVTRRFCYGNLSLTFLSPPFPPAKKHSIQNQSIIISKMCQLAALVVNVDLCLSQWVYCLCIPCRSINRNVVADAKFVQVLMTDLA